MKLPFAFVAFGEPALEDGDNKPIGRAVQVASVRAEIGFGVAGKTDRERGIFLFHQRQAEQALCTTHASTCTTLWCID